MRQIDRVTLVLIGAIATFQCTAIGQGLPKLCNAEEAQQITSAAKTIAINRTPDENSGTPESKSGGIEEVVTGKHKKKYEAWRNEFLSTEIGRREWEMFEHNTRFTLTIALSCNKGAAAETGNYIWNDSGALIAATITLGCRIDEGYPAPVELYPVTYSLRLFEAWYVKNGGEILAAAKLAHELGHVEQMASMDGQLAQLQYRLIPLYLKILRSCHFSVHDPNLTELARQIGGTPVEVLVDREYWAEANALHYLREKLAKKLLPRSLLILINQNIESYAKNHKERFAEIAESKSPLAPCASERLTATLLSRHTLPTLALTTRAFIEQGGAIQNVLSRYEKAAMKNSSLITSD